MAGRSSVRGQMGKRRQKEVIWATGCGQLRGANCARRPTMTSTCLREWKNGLSAGRLGRAGVSGEKSRGVLVRKTPVPKVKAA